MPISLVPNDIVVYSILSYLDFEPLCDDVRMVSTSFKALSEAAAGHWLTTTCIQHQSSFKFDDVQVAARSIRAKKQKQLQNEQKDADPSTTNGITSRITPVQVMWFRNIVGEARSKLRPAIRDQVDVLRIDITASNAKTLLYMRAKDLNNIPISNGERYKIAHEKLVAVAKTRHRNDTVQWIDQIVAESEFQRAVEAHDLWRLMDVVSYIVSCGLDRYLEEVLPRDVRRHNRTNIKSAAIVQAVSDLESILSGLSMRYTIDRKRQRVVVENRLRLQYLTARKRWKRCGTTNLSSTLQATLQPLHMKLMQMKLYECTRSCGWAGCSQFGSAR